MSVSVRMVEGPPQFIRNVQRYQVTAEGALVLTGFDDALLAVFAPGQWRFMTADV